MIDLIDKLNTCSDVRTVFYCFVFLCALGIITSGLTDIITGLIKLFKNNKN